MGFVSASDGNLQDNATLELTSIDSVDENSNIDLHMSDNTSLGNDYSQGDCDNLLSSSDDSLSGDVLSSDGDYHFVFSNVSRYDFNDYYFVKVVDANGNDASKGVVDFFIDDAFIGSSYLSYGGVAYIDLNQHITVGGSYTITCLYSVDEYSSDVVIAQDSIVVNNISLLERDIRILFEGVKVYDLGQRYTVRIVDSSGRPVSKGHVDFVFLNNVYNSTIDEEGYASFVLDNDFDVIGHCYIGSIYSDDNLYSLSVTEQVTIGTRVLASFNEISYSTRIPKWLGYDYEFRSDGYYALIDDLDYSLSNGFINRETYHVIKFDGTSYLVHNVTINDGASLLDFFDILSSNNCRWDIVILNLCPGQGLSNQVDPYGDEAYRMLNANDGVSRPNTWSDREWEYAIHFTYGQLIINGNGVILNGMNRATNFMYVGYDASVVLNNVGLYMFNHVFMNHGSVICNNDTFRDNRAHADYVGSEGAGTVAQNFNTIVFNNCTFDGNSAVEDGALTSSNYEGKWSILMAFSNSKTVFIDCTFVNSYKDSLYGSTGSMITFFTDDPDIYEKKFDESTFDMGAGFSVVNSSVLKNNNSGPVVFNCNNLQELYDAFWIINSFLPAIEVVINLSPIEYIINTDDYYRNSFSNVGWKTDWDCYDDETFFNMNYMGEFLLNVGSIPVTINGNGATVKLTHVSVLDRYHFAVVPNFGSLTLNNLTLAHFNTAIYNYGTLIANNCVFRDNNIDRDEITEDKVKGGAFVFNGGQGLFVNCSFRDNEGNDDANSFYAKNSYLEFINCDAYWSDDDRHKVGEIHDSYVKATDTYNLIFDCHGDSVVQYFTGSGSDVIYFNIGDIDSLNSAYDYLAGENYDNTSVKVFVLNFTNDCSFDLGRFTKYKSVLIIQSNGFDVRFNSTVKIWSNCDVYFVNMNFIGYAFNLFINEGSCSFVNCSFSDNHCNLFLENKGSCNIVNCSFTDNTCKNFIENEGSLSIVDCIFKNNTCREYGVIYNKYGSLLCANVTFSDNGVCDIHNFRTGDCALLDSPASIKYEEPMSTSELAYAKMSSKGWATIAGLLFGAAIGCFVGPCAIGIIIAIVGGICIGATLSYYYITIEKNTFRESGSTLHNLLTMAEFALASGAAAAQGYYFGSVFREYYWNGFREFFQSNAGQTAVENNPQNIIIEPAQNPGLNVQPGVQPSTNPPVDINQPLIPIDDSQIIPVDPATQGDVGNPIIESLRPNSEDILTKYKSQEEFEQGFLNSLRGALNDNVQRIQKLPVVYQSMFDTAIETLNNFMTNVQTSLSSWVNLYFEFEEIFALVSALEVIDNEVTVDTSIQNIIESNNAVNEDNANNIINVEDNQNLNEINTDSVPANNNNRGLVNSPMWQQIHVHANLPSSMTIEDGVRLESMINYNSYGRYQNATHIHRVVELYGRFCQLRREVSAIFPTFEGLPNDLRLGLSLFDTFLNANTQLSRASLNSLFNPIRYTHLELWENRLQAALQAWNDFHQTSNIDLNPNVNRSDFNSLNREVTGIFDNVKKANKMKGKFKSLYDKYKDKFVANSNPEYNGNATLLMQEIYNPLVELITELNSNNAEWANTLLATDYDTVISFDYADFVMQNPLNGIFNRYRYVLSLNNGWSSVSVLRGDIVRSLETLRLINNEAYNDVMKIFDGRTFEVWFKDNGALSMSVAKIRDIYVRIYQTLGKYRSNSEVLQSERYLYIYGIKYLQNFEDSYDLLGNGDRSIVIRYLIEECRRGLNEYHVFDDSKKMYTLQDLINLFEDLQNVNDISSQHFRELYDLHRIIMKGNRIENIFNLENVDDLSSEELGKIILKEMPLFALINSRYSIFWSKDINCDIDGIVRICNLIQNHETRDLILLYGDFKNSNGQLRAEYELEYRLEKLMPLPLELVESLTNLWLIRNHFSYYLSGTLHKLAGYNSLSLDDAVYLKLIDSSIPDIRISLPIRVHLYNLLLNNNYDSSLFNFDYQRYLFSKFSIDPKYYKGFVEDYDKMLKNEENIVAEIMSLDMIKSKQKNLNKTKTYKFRQIDAAGMNDRLNLIKNGSPLTYYLLISAINNDYPDIFEKDWYYDKTSGEFYFGDVGSDIAQGSAPDNALSDESFHSSIALDYSSVGSEVRISYSRFCNYLLNQIEKVTSIFKTFDRSLYFEKSFPLDVDRWEDNNAYNNIFNKLQFFKQVNPTPEFINYFAHTIDNDLNYLKNIDKKVYDIIVKRLFKDSNSAVDLVKNKHYDYKDLFNLYESIFEYLGSYRNSTIVLNNEIDVLINQLQSQEIKAMSSKDLEEKVRSYLLNYIYRWESYHLYVSPVNLYQDFSNIAIALNVYDKEKNYTLYVGRLPGLSANLMNASLEEIFNKYSQVRAQLFFGDVFLSQTFDKLTIDEMKKVLLDDLYKLQHGIENIGDVNVQNVVVEFFKSRGVDFYSQKEWENYVNGFNSVGDLIQLYNTLHNILHTKNAGSIAKMFVNIKNTLQAGQNNADELLSRWISVEKNYPLLSGVVVEKLLNGNLTAYVAKHGALNTYNEIMRFLETCLYNDDALIKEVDAFSDIKRIVESNAFEYDDEDDVNFMNVIGGDSDQIHFLGSLQALIKKYPKIGNDVLINLMEKYPSRYYSKVGGLANVRKEIMEYIRQKHFPDAGNGNLDGNAVNEIANIINVEINRPEFILINGKLASEFSVEDIYSNIMKRVGELKDSSSASLKSKAEELYKDYLDTLKLDKDSKSNVIKDKVALIKNSLLKILYQVRQSENLDNALKEEVEMLDGIIDIDLSDDLLFKRSEFIKVSANGLSWDDIRQAGKNAQSRAFGICYSLEHIDPVLSEYLNKRLSYLYDDFLYDSNSTSSNYIAIYNKFIDSLNILFEGVLERHFGKMSTNGLNRQGITNFADTAVSQANDFCLIIEDSTPELANYLRNAVAMLYNDFLEESNTNYVLSYNTFIDRLNALFKYVFIMDKTISKEDFSFAFKSLRGIAMVYAEDVGRYNPVLSDFLTDNIISYWASAIDGKEYTSDLYAKTVNYLNELFRFDKTYSVIKSIKFDLKSTDNLQESDIVGLAKDARSDALKYLEQLALSNPTLANDLKNKINSAYDIFVDSLNKGPALAYELFIMDLNMLFENVRIGGNTNYEFELKPTRGLKVDDVASLITEAQYKALNYCSQIQNKAFVPILKKAIGNVYEDAIELWYEGVNIYMVYDSFIRELNLLFNFYNSQSAFSSSSNPYDYIFNIGSLGTEKVDGEYLENILFDDMNQLKSINPNLYNEFLQKYFKANSLEDDQHYSGNMLPESFNSLEDAFKQINKKNRNDAIKQYQSIYSNIFEELSKYRNNDLLSNLESSLIIGLLKAGKGDPSLFRLLSNTERINLVQYLENLMNKNSKYWPGEYSEVTIHMWGSNPSSVNDFKVLFAFYKMMMPYMNQNIFNRNDFASLSAQEMGDILLRELPILFSYNSYNGKYVSEYFGFKNFQYGSGIDGKIKGLVKVNDVEELISIYTKAKSIFKELSSDKFLQNAVNNNQPIDENKIDYDNPKNLISHMELFFFPNKSERAAFKTFIDKFKISDSAKLKILIRAYNHRLKDGDCDLYKLFEDMVASYQIDNTPKPGMKYIDSAKLVLEEALDYSTAMTKEDYGYTDKFANHINNLYKKYIGSSISLKNYTDFVDAINDLFKRYGEYKSAAKLVFDDVKSTLEVSSNFLNTWKQLKVKYANFINKMELRVFAGIDDLDVYVQLYGDDTLRNKFLDGIKNIRLEVIYSWVNGSFVI